MKRFFDIVGALIGLVLLAPIIFVLALLIRKRLGAPIFFKQIRPGLNGNPFKMIKFRTMTDERTDNNDLKSDRERLTPFGQFLRSSSLDELPELWNVLKGEMSLVGPRPLLMEYVELYTPEQALRMNVRPGITGWAQVNGRNTLSWEEKFDLDIWYVNNQSMLLDFKIIWRTLSKVAKRDGVSAEGEATMSKFEGSQKE